MTDKNINKEDLKKLENLLGKKIKQNSNWTEISITPGLLNSKTLEEFKDKLDWKKVSQYQKLNSEDLEKYKDKLDWICLSFSHVFTLEELKKYRKTVDWFLISKFQPLTNDILYEFKYDIISDLVVNNLFLKNQYISTNTGNTYYKLFTPISKKEIKQNSLIPIPDSFNELINYEKICKIIIQRDDLITCEWAKKVTILIDEYNGLDVVNSKKR